MSESLCRIGRVVVALTLSYVAQSSAQLTTPTFLQKSLPGPWTVKPVFVKGMAAPDDPGRTFVCIAPNETFMVAAEDLSFAASRRADKVWLADLGTLVFAALENDGSGLYALSPDGSVKALAHYPGSPPRYEGLGFGSAWLRSPHASAAAEPRKSPFYLLAHDDSKPGATSPALHVWDGQARKRLVGVGDTIETPAGPSEIAYLHVKDQGGGAALVEYRKKVPQAQRRKGYSMVGATDLERSPAGWLLVRRDRVTPLLADGAPMPGSSPAVAVTELAPHSLQTDYPWFQRPARFAGDGTLYGAVDYSTGRKARKGLFRLSPEKAERVIGERDPDPLRPGKKVPGDPRLMTVINRGVIVGYYEPTYPVETQASVAFFGRDGKVANLVPPQERFFGPAPMQVQNLVCTDEPQFACYYLGVQFSTDEKAIYASVQLVAADERGPRGSIEPMPLSTTSYFDVVGGPHPGIFLHAILPHDLTKETPEKAFELDLFLDLREEKPVWQLVPTFEGQSFDLGDVVAWRNANEAIVQLPDGLYIAKRD
jgi:hypothetical protein